MSMGKNKGSSSTVTNPATVWRGQSGFLQDMYGRGQALLDQTQNWGAGIAGQLQSYLTPQGFGQMYQSAAQPMLNSIRDNSIQAMNLGGDRQGVAQANVAQNLGHAYLENLPSLYNLGMNMSGWGPLFNQAQLLGGPTVLSGGGRGSSKESGFKLGFI